MAIYDDDEGLTADAPFVDVINVRSSPYNAAGDGVTDDTAAIQAAINACTNTRATVYFPPGRYLVSPGSNAYALTIPPPYSPNGVLGMIILCGDGGTQLHVNAAQPFNIGSTIVMTSTANKPVFKIAGARSVVFRDLNIQGTDKTVSGSVGISIYDFNSDLQFEGVGLNRFDSLVNIGDPALPDGGSHNNDVITFRHCRWSNANVAISNYGFNSYSVVDEKGFFASNLATAYKYYPDPAGTFRANNDMKFYGSHFLITDTVVWSAGSAKLRLGVTGLYGCLFEANGADTIRLLRQEDTTAGNAHGFIVKDCTIIMSSLTAAQLTTPIITYYGRGPFVFEDNYVDSLHFEILVGTYENTVNHAAARIENNRSTGKMIVRYPSGNPYPAITESDNSWYQLSARNATDAAVPVSDVNAASLRHGVGVYSVTPSDVAVTVRAGSMFLSSTGPVVVTTTGTYGTLTGVTGNTTSGQPTLTLNGGATSERAKIIPGSQIAIAGVSGTFEVDVVSGETVTLRTNAGATVASAAVSFVTPVTANVLGLLGGVTYQSFNVFITNTAGTLQHRITGENTAPTASAYATKISGASASLANTPAVASGVDFVSGVGIDSTATERLIFNTAAQADATFSVITSLERNTTGTAIMNPTPRNVSTDVNGTTRNRFGLAFQDATGAAFALTTANIPVGAAIRVRVLAFIQ